MILRYLIIGMACTLLSGTALSRDGYNDGVRPVVCDMPSGPRLVKCQEWISTIKRPDYPGASCCGDGDAFIADDFELVDGKLYAIISVEYPAVTSPGATLDDGSQAAPSIAGVHKGQKILIPPEKINDRPDDTNRSGHGVVFLKPSNGEVLCYRFPPLI